MDETDSPARIGTRPRQKDIVGLANGVDGRAGGEAGESDFLINEALDEKENDRYFLSKKRKHNPLLQEMAGNC